MPTERKQRTIVVSFPSHESDIYEAVVRLANIQEIRQTEVIRNILRKYIKKEEQKIKKTIINILEEKKKALD